MDGIYKHSNLEDGWFVCIAAIRYQHGDGASVYFVTKGTCATKRAASLWIL